ncbi:ROK family protein [Isoptericola cucumis]
MLAERLGLSKPTMSAAMSTLTAQELVAGHGEARGATGRSAQVYALGRQAGYVVGLDIGNTQVRVVAAGLDGRTLHEAHQQIPASSRSRRTSSVAAAADLVETVGRKLPDGAGPLRFAVAAMPALIRPTGSPDRDGSTLDRLREALPQGVPLRLENNVNCATIAEQHHGVARGRESFVYLQAGVKIGVGIVANDRLLRGAGGGAGEIGHLTFPWSDTDEPRRGGLERHLGSTALLRRVREGWPTDAGRAPRDAADLFARAGHGEEAARDAVRNHAVDLGRLVSSVVAMLDPGLVVMGGGVGQNPELLPEIRRTVKRLAWPTEVEVSSLGQDATLLGAVGIATEFGLDALLDSHTS